MSEAAEEKIVRTIRTGHYSDDFLEVLNETKKMHSDPNNFNRRIRKTFSLMNITHAPDGEVVFNFHERDNCYYPYYRLWCRDKSDEDIKHWIANKIKDTVHYMFYRHYRREKQLLHNAVMSDEFWARDNEMVVPTLNFNVKTAYYVFDSLFGKKRCLAKSYDKKFQKNMVGKQYDPVVTELIASSVNEKYRLKQECEAALDKLRNDMDNNIIEIRKKYFDIIEKTKVEYINKIESLDKEVKDLCALSANQLQLV